MATTATAAATAATATAINGKRTSGSPCPSADQVQPGTAADRPYQKRIRLSVACNQCRKRKVRCDTSLPKCRNCVQRNEHCETSDLRRPDHGPGIRVLAIKDGGNGQGHPQPHHPGWAERETDIASHASTRGSGSPEHDNQQQHTSPNPRKRTQSQSSSHSNDGPRPRTGGGYGAGFWSPRTQRESSRATTRTPDTRSTTADRYHSESSAKSGTESTGSSRAAAEPTPQLSWVQRAYQVSASERNNEHNADGDTVTTNDGDNNNSHNHNNSQNKNNNNIGNNTDSKDNEDHVDMDTSATPDVVVNTDDTAYRVKFVGGSSLQCLCTFVDLHLCSKGLRPVSPGFRQGMQYSEEFDLPLTPHLPTLPDRPELDRYMSAFMRRVWPLYPVVDEVTVATDVDYIMHVQALHGSLFARHLPQLTLPTLAVTYAILALGSAELAGHATALSASYLTAAYSLYGHLIALPYTVSVQALLLITLALRAQMRDGQAWQVLGQALRIAYSIGLHRTAAPSAAVAAAKKQKTNKASAITRAAPPPKAPTPGCSPSYQSDAGLHSRLWWSCYALERLVQLESGRPAVVHDRVGDGISNIDSDREDRSDHGSGDNNNDSESNANTNNNNNEPQQRDEADGPARRRRPPPPPRQPRRPGPPLFVLDAATHGSEYFVAWVSLAQIMGRISDQFYGQKPRNSVELFTRVYRLDRMLTDWKESLPEIVRLRKDAAARRGGAGGGRQKEGSRRSAGGGELGSGQADAGDSPGESYLHHLASFLSLQYYMARITLLRIAIIFPHDDFLREIGKQQRHLPHPDAHARLVSAADVCFGAARSVVTEATDLADEHESHHNNNHNNNNSDGNSLGGTASVVLGANPMFFSAMVLALGILRQPARRLARADLQLFHLALELVEEYLSRWVMMGSSDSISNGDNANGIVMTDMLASTPTTNATPGGGSSGNGGKGDDMLGLVDLLREQVDAYHARFSIARRKSGVGPANGSAAANSTMASNSSSSSSSNGSGIAGQNPMQLLTQQQQQHVMGYGDGTASSLTSPSVSTNGISSNSSMPPPPPPPQTSSAGAFFPHSDDNNSNGAGGEHMAGMSGFVSQGDHIPASSGLMPDNTLNSTSYAFDTLLPSFVDGGTSNSNMLGGTVGSSSSSMEMFDGLAFDELWDMIGTTDLRGEYM